MTRTDGPGDPRVGAISEEYPGRLLDLRHHVTDSLNEVRRGVALARAAGFHPARPDDLPTLAGVAPLTGAPAAGAFLR